MSTTEEYVYRIHPAIGIGRVGNSQEYYIGPETMAGMPVEGSKTTGGIPIRPATESTTITSSELRDKDGAFKRQAARFKIYQYPKLAPGQSESYPNGGGTEIVIGSVVNGKTVQDILWTVHIANKKANWYYLNDGLGMAVFEPGNRSQLQLRNSAEGSNLNSPVRLKKLVIDPGPRATLGTSKEAVHFDRGTMASCRAAGAEIKQLAAYPKSFPTDSFATLYSPRGDIDTLGELRTDDHGRLLVLGGYGRASAWMQPDGMPFPLSDDDVNSDGWFDDTGDGPIAAALVFADGSVEEVHGAWVMITDPGYAPQTLNVISLWDEVFDTWIRNLELQPGIFDGGFDRKTVHSLGYPPDFEVHIFPIFRATMLQQWNINLPEMAIRAHEAIGSITDQDDPANTILTGLAYIRNPNSEGEAFVGSPLMPLSLGDAGKPFLTLTRTQYFFLEQWNNNHFRKGKNVQFGPGEFLDRAVLANCLGGRFSPGIDMTFLVRDPDVYFQNWKESGAGPFRLRAKTLNYSCAQVSQPFLTVGYIPLHPVEIDQMPAPLEPGDVSKFMSIPWHTDYNSCATHNTAPNPTKSTTMYWSWPAQRPVTVYAASDVRDGKLGAQRYSVRGNGTYSDDLLNVGRYQVLLDMVFNWHRIGVILQGNAIDGDVVYSPDYYLEVESQLDDEIQPWPMNSNTAE